MASIDGSDEDNEASNDNDDSAADKPARYAVSDVTVASAASTSAGRRGLGKMGKAHQNIARSSYHGNNNNNSSGSAPRNILSPLKLNGRSSPSTANSPSGAVQTDLKGKGKAPFYRDTKSSSPGPLSAVSSNRTVRPATHSPHALRAGSITPSVHVANRMNKPSRRTQAMSFDSSLPETDHLSAHEQPNDATEQDEVRNSPLATMPSSHRNVANLLCTVFPGNSKPES